MRYNRILLKLSGEALMGDKQFGIDTTKLTSYANEIKSVVDLGVEVAVVIGGGNIFRGVQVEGQGLDRGHNHQWDGLTICFRKSPSRNPINDSH